MKVSAYDNPFVYYTVTLDGKDVSDICFEADNVKGKVGLHKLNKDGVIYYDPLTDDVAKEYKHGKVTITKMEI